MQAVILAAGRGTRMGELTAALPKPMLQINDTTLLEHKFNILPDAVDEIILIVGYLHEKIRERFGNTYRGKKLTYIEQKNITGGTADALWYAKDILKGKFIVMMGDDLYAKEDIEKCLAHEWALLVDRVPDTSVGGKVVFDNEGHVSDIIEHRIRGEGVVGTNMFVLDNRIFAYPPVPKSEDSSELGLPQTVLHASHASGIPLSVVEATRWIQITVPEDIARAERLLTRV